MEPVRVEATVQPNGRVVIENLPFEEGEKVEVIISETNGHALKSDNPYPLRGTPYRYDDPFSPLISPEDLEPLK